MNSGAGIFCIIVSIYVLTVVLNSLPVIKITGQFPE